MRNLSKSVKEYLSKPTEFAIQITGNWGRGKTYFYKNTVQKLICEVPTLINANKNYKPVYISLFGLRSIEDIATKIVFDFYQSIYFKDYHKKKKLKVTQSVLKIGLRGFLNFLKLGSLDDYLIDIKTVGENVLDTTELVVCFDDLERKDSSLNIEDLTGYINSLVDEGIKVLIISNEDLLLKSGQYKNLKEKIIGVTIEFVPDSKEILESIIRSRYSNFPVYSKFLDDSMDNLVKLSASVENNFRHIVYALDNLQHCYSEIKNSILDTKHEIADKVKHELENISNFILAFSIEYKSSSLKYTDMEAYIDDGLEMLMKFSLANDVHQDLTKKDASKSDFELLIEKYGMNKDKYRFYESIFKYLTAYDEFDINFFIKEFKQKFRLEKGKVLPHYEIFQSLNYNECFDLTDDQYRQNTLSLIKYANDGYYNLPEYLSVMHYAERLDNILNLDLDKVCDELILGLGKHIDNLPMTGNRHFTEFEMSGKSGPLSLINGRLYEAGMKKIQLFKNKIVNEEREAFAKLFTNNLIQFQNKYYSDKDFKSNLLFTPFMHLIEMEKYFDLIKKSSGQSIIFLKDFLKERFEASHILKDEENIPKDLAKLFSELKKEVGKMNLNKIKSYLFIELADSIIKIAEEEAAAVPTK